MAKLACAQVGAVCVGVLLAATAATGATAATAPMGADANDLPAVRLLRTGTLVRPPQGAANMGEYLRALAAPAGTEVDKSNLDGELARKTPAPAAVGKEARPALALLAEALTGKGASFAVDTQGRWCIHEHGDTGRRFSYAAAGGILCVIDHFTRPRDGKPLRTITHLAFDRGAAAEVVATRMDLNVVEAVNADGKVFRPEKPAAGAAANWCANQQWIALPRDRFKGSRIARLVVEGQLAVRTGVTTFRVPSLGHTAPQTLTQSGVTVTIQPLEEGKRQGMDVWFLPVEIRTKYESPAGLTAHGEQVRFLSTDGKVLPRTGWSGSHGRDCYSMKIRIRAHSIDPASTVMVLEHPTGLKIVPFRLTFRDVEIRDAAPRP